MNLDSIAGIAGVIAALAGIAIAIYTWRAGKQVSVIVSSPYAREFTRAIDSITRSDVGERVVGVQSLVNLADNWETGRQTCIDALCAYVRSSSASNSPVSMDIDRHSEQREVAREAGIVRSAVIRAISEHLRSDAPIKWHGCIFDFTGATLDGGDFSQAAYIDGTKVIFREAVFGNGTIDFSNSLFDDALIDFTHASFPEGAVNLARCKFEGGLVVFRNASFSGGYVDFSASLFRDGMVDFSGSSFSGGMITFANSRLEGTDIEFARVQFEGGLVDLRGVSSYDSPPRFDLMEEGHPEELLLPRIAM